MSDHRLAREARRMARIYRGTIAIEAFAIVAQSALYFTTGQTKVSAIAAAAVAIPASAIKAFWWKRRARWYADTERWWERLEEAPAVTLALPVRVNRQLAKPVSPARLVLTLAGPSLLVLGIIGLTRL